LCLSLIFIPLPFPTLIYDKTVPSLLDSFRSEFPSSSLLYPTFTVHLFHLYDLPSLLSIFHYICFYVTAVPYSFFSPFITFIILSYFLFSLPFFLCVLSSSPSFL
jgi:hypothetical protein